MTVLLVGGTGLVGGKIAELLATRPEPVRALVRSGRRSARLRDLGFTLEAGDLRDMRALRRAVRGVETVITTAQGSPFSRRTSLDAVDGRGNQELIAAAREADVEHMVFISALKADEGAAQVPQLAYKHAAEQALVASGIGYTILRPASLQETFGEGFAPFKRTIERYGIGLTLGPGREQHSFVAAEDVARAAVLALDLPQARDQVLPLGGPEDLSYREAYARIAAITGRKIRVAAMPRPLLRLAATFAWPALPELEALFALFDFYARAGCTCVTPGWLADALGKRRSFDDGVRQMYGSR